MASFFDFTTPSLFLVLDQTNPTVENQRSTPAELACQLQLCLLTGSREMNEESSLRFCTVQNKTQRGRDNSVLLGNLEHFEIIYVNIMYV